MTHTVIFDMVNDAHDGPAHLPQSHLFSAWALGTGCYCGRWEFQGSSTKHLKYSGFVINALL